MKEKDLEKKIIADFENGKYLEIKNKKSLYQKMAAETKDRINLRIDPKVKAKFIKKSEAEGIPYQTLINSVLKKYVDGKLIESSYEEILLELKKEIRTLKKGA
jgi:predicted DNA binding CopG/RHH family protein